MDHEMRTYRCRYLLAMALCFVVGLLFGLLFHLPEVSFLDDTDDQFTIVQVDSSFRLNGRPVGGLKSLKVEETAPQVTVTIGNTDLHEEEMKKSVQPAFDSLDQIVEGIYWSKKLEQSLPRRFTDVDSSSWRQVVHGSKVVDVQEGCGRMQNRMVTFEDGTKSCARYRINTDQIQGEVYSYYLSRLLGIGNVPPLVMVTADTKGPQWKNVGDKVSAAKWDEEKPLVLSQFVQNLVPAYIPHGFRSDSGAQQMKSNDLLRKSNSELVELVQWSDLIILDYLTGNLDRIVNNLFNLQWNSEIMSSPAHNLEKSGDFLIFLDNESGLFHGYRLLDKYQTYHDQLLRSLCIFRKDTVQKLRDFHSSGEIGNAMHDLVHNSEKYEDLLPSIPEKNVKVLNERIGHVLNQVESCQKRR